ncbi:hypothetical protein C7M84_007082 [Penaeus vannamei]|uniref:Uncharacterized protein n=1 Tax=Penaeus vannamei TaxID=6689 RepID=A0A423TD39_PENVA|nr:hypothetical protein C7M84_007082 [Penaeus vannamei]
MRSCCFKSPSCCSLLQPRLRTLSLHFPTFRTPRLPFHSPCTPETSLSLHSPHRNSMAECLQGSYRGTKSCLAKRIFAPVCGRMGARTPMRMFCAVPRLRTGRTCQKSRWFELRPRSCEDNVEEKEGEQRAKEAEEMKGEEETAEGKEGENEGVELAENRLFP